MEPREFLRSIYLGDRACTGISIDENRKKVAIHVDVISRIPRNSDSWNYYTDRDIPEGCIVFEGVEFVRFNPDGPLPNDLINSIEVSEGSNETAHLFEVSIGSVDEKGNSTEVVIEIEAEGIYLQDPRTPDLPIRE